MLALIDANIGDHANDVAVSSINERRGRPYNARVPFDAWAKELGVVRGAA